MSIVVNGAEQIATHFNTTSAHVLDVYAQYQNISNTTWAEFTLIVLILALGIGFIAAFIHCFTNKYVDSGEVIAVFAYAALIVGFIAVIAGAVYIDMYLDAQPIVIEYNMYYYWIKGVVGA